MSYYKSTGYWPIVCDLLYTCLYLTLDCNVYIVNTAFSLPPNITNSLISSILSNISTFYRSLLCCFINIFIGIYLWRRSQLRIDSELLTMSKTGVSIINPVETKQAAVTDQTTLRSNLILIVAIYAPLHPLLYLASYLGRLDADQLCFAYLIVGFIFKISFVNCLFSESFTLQMISDKLKHENRNQFMKFVFNEVSLYLL